MKKIIIASLIFNITQIKSMDNYTNLNEPIQDIREAFLKFPHNKQDENGNTFWHQLAYASAEFDDWSQVEKLINDFKNNNKNWLPNPFIKNKNDNTAKEEAEKIFHQSGCPVCGFLVFYLENLERNFLGAMAIKSNMELMETAQEKEHPDN